MSEMLLGALLLLTIAWLIVRIRRNRAEAIADAKPRQNETGKYHAVAIAYSENACDAAKAMTGRRFLSGAAPPIPLPDCDNPKCQCQYSHYKDRRRGSDRRSPFVPGGATGATGSFKQERRQRIDRRQSDND